MESLDEFDNEYPLSVSFCKLISTEDFEEQSLSYTQQCLHELFSAMEQNPGICERAVRKQKQMEKEEAGLMSFLKAKVCWTLQGELNYCNYVGFAEMQEKVSQLRRDMQRASNYARAAKTGKGQRARQLRGKKNPLEGGFSPFHSRIPETPKVTLPRVFGPFPDVVKKQVDRAAASSPDLKQKWAGVSMMSQKSMVDLRPIVLNPGGFYNSLQAGNCMNKLKHTNFSRLLGSAPMPSPQNADSTGTKPAASVLNTPMPCEFQGGAEDEMDSEKPGPSSSSKGA
ncbi:uncharacterized protein [Struthio camelus]|uniref:uncharacterized protein n=1 Tax=Struthio camelus TaxID=8801 RepID=UPI00051E4D94|nr:PREDICTED: uncharacterized protein LOC104152223 [Struthio camelus australis]